MIPNKLMCINVERLAICCNSDLSDSVTDGPAGYSVTLAGRSDLTSLVGSTQALNDGTGNAP